ASTGAADDLVKVTDIARSMVMRYGMEESLGTLAYEEPRSPFLQGPMIDHGPERAYSEETARRIDESVRRLVEQALQRAGEILQRNRTLLEQGARELLQKETLSESEIQKLATQLAH
ncbi:MAG TPA: cell division protein FtsH, partial [Casimicrobiaceae bacterium]|nr:cell division protein FtsH [Casimicrobiaceae bacterium]